MASVKSRQQLEPIVVMHDNNNSNNNKKSKPENAKRKVESKKQRAKGSCEWVKPGKAVYKLHMERTRRSHMTANAICEAHLQQQQEKENGMPN